MAYLCNALYGQMLLTSKPKVSQRSFAWMCRMDKFALLVVFGHSFPEDRHRFALVPPHLPPIFLFALTAAEPQFCGPFTAAADLKRAQK